MGEIWVGSLGQKDPLEKEMATHSSILACRTAWTEEPKELQFTGLQKAGQDRGTNTFIFTFFPDCITTGREKIIKLKMKPKDKHAVLGNI